MDTGEIEEIHEEDRHMAELLEDLMDEFEVKFSEMNVPLQQFMESYWLPRMQKVKEERGEMSA